MKSNEMLTGILVPMHEEIELIIEHMQIDSVYESGQRKFYKGTFGGKPCVVARSRIGKVASSVTAAVMIEHFKIDQMIVTGVAGAVAPHLKLGDIVVASESVQHDLDARPLFPQYEAPMLGKAFFPCNEILIQNALAACKDFIVNDFTQFIHEEDIESFDLKKPSIYSGQICCGDQFIGSAVQLNKISKALPEVLCVEMEGGAVGQVCHEYNIPYIIVRTISDSANDHAPVDFTKYIQRVAKYYTLGITRKIVRSINL